ncbi:p-aminobenzoyl-glutamate hydrolase subunit B [Clostridium saccharobutylicum]|uniref:Peptidase M20 domain-containing protein 2 n=1 Tax=Clostridium saccharobutylicum DSM 13864 TaxID=1345695 RepID=U5MP47_CLOSA|nr:p-aminobenzoyl-glutamate hydrolase subunit B [Clostridium saccharobutylicum]AGX41212.1 p-aminobenzoyl-glutamate hydrolase subunit B [Clostridium saccharobutylicum DSM 13864]AQR88498.1 p-aminobenzoyl-glutamate hydrolase subunit B [Clostridium saccharobutylicum]AQR98396.1 p-aminobenzoyl-glutamate hydrolase subunit B [Clostridium saccharobutylicum]AQS08107.1 p-aminobenzoyl-glutamate hydrolase subunit B [Clostridium saccharobutylicum]AQS12386.1 p-aminobenzoyl-glutamate hydrolase subunit B [Clos
MKQKIISFLSTCNEDIKDLCTYLYKNPETSYNESKSSNYICELLEKYDFKITKNFLNINNSFVAKKGSGHPKICYLCEYDAIENKGHITGHNMVTAMSVEATLALGHVIDTIGGSVILIGCPGEYLGGTKGTMVKQGVFDDIDIVMLAHPDTLTCESGSSSAIIPLGVTFEGEDGLSFLNKNTYTPLDSALLTINILNSIKKSFPDNLEINSIISNGGYTPLLIPSKSDVKFYIRASNSKTAEYGDTKIRKIVKLVTDLTEIKSKFFLYEYPNKELITNRTLNRLFSHNLKENGIININPPRDIYAGLSIGDVSHKVPCIHPYVSIIEESSITKYGSTDFAKATVSDFALKQCHIVALSLACTAIDLIKNETLLNEVKHEFFNNLK